MYTPWTRNIATPREYFWVTAVKVAFAVIIMAALAYFLIPAGGQAIDKTARDLSKGATENFHGEPMPAGYQTNCKWCHIPTRESCQN